MMMTMTMNHATTTPSTREGQYRTTNARTARTRRGGYVRRPSASDDVFEALAATATSDGLSIHPDVRVGALEPGPLGIIGVCATKTIPARTAIFTRAMAATAYDAEYARRDDAFGLNAALSAYEGEVERTISDEIALTLLLVTAKRHADISPLGSYANALPKAIAATPVLYGDDALEALVPVLSLNLVDQVDLARGEFALAFDDARQIVARMHGESDLQELEFAWAWSMVRSRAITFAVRKATTGDIERKRCLVPVCDVLNHSPTSLADVLSSDDERDGVYSQALSVPGPNVQIETNGSGESVWMTTRDVVAGEALRWTYGELSNEEMWLWYGFVPASPIHGDCAVPFNLPDTVFKNGLEAVAKDDKAETMALRKKLLERAGVLGLNEGEELSFVVSVRGAPKTLGGIAGVMCCDADEVVAIAASTIISANGGVDGALFELKPESRRRAGRYVAWLLTQIESFVCGASDDEVAEYERIAKDVGGLYEQRFNDAKALRIGARETFKIIHRSLTDESLLTDGAWIDDATKRLVSA
jgi:hypothetical protein